MFVKMGYKKWTYGEQKGIRVYTPAIRSLATILNVPSADGSWNSLDEFLTYLEKGGEGKPPYTRNLLVTTYGKKPLSISISVNRHDGSSQGYITAPKGTWLDATASKYLDKDFLFEYLPGPKQDVLVVSSPSADPVAERDRDTLEIQRRVRTFCAKNHYPPPQKAREIGLYFELKEVNFLKKEGLKPYHRYPFVYSQLEFLRKDDVSCDIDLLDVKDSFLKYVEVKAVEGAPGNDFSLTIKEWQSRDWCSKNEIGYEIVIYYHAGHEIIERKVVAEDEKLIAEPSGYWCSFP